ncbi:MAG: GH39 family glycosyl hydrolase [Stenotrophobium sp.]
MKLNLYAWILVLLMPCAATAAELPPLVLPDGVGINIHFTRGHERDLDMIADAGIKVARMDLIWADTERLKGVYDWSAYDELTANLLKRGIRPYYILGYSNPIYEGTTPKFWEKTWPYDELMSPQHPDSIAAFARWAAAAAVHFRKAKPVLEIWNEPNIQFWKPAPNVVQYTRLAEYTCVAIHQAEPAATVVGPAVCAFVWKFLKDFFSTGMLGCLDAVSVHPYRGRFAAPETATSEYAQLRQLIKQYTPASKKTSVPILSGEWGYSTTTDGTPLQMQADYLVRMQLFNLMNDVPISIMYDWVNDGSYGFNVEHNYGIVYPDLSPKPAYIAIRTLTHTLAGFHLVRRLELEQPWDYALLFENDAGRRIIAAWTLWSPHVISLPAFTNASTPMLVSGDGKISTARTKNRHIELEFSPTPQYLQLDNLPVASKIH